MRGFIELRVRAINEAPTKKPKGGTGEFKIDMQRQKKEKGKWASIVESWECKQIETKTQGIKWVYVDNKWREI